MRNDQKAWFLRVLLVLQSPRSVFAALRDDSDGVADARQDAAGAIIWLAGIAAVLATTVASTLLDDPARDWVVLVVWAFLAGGLSGFTLYFFLGKVLHVALRRLGSRGSFRRARHLLAFAAAPVALALFVYWPVRIAIYGEDLFRFDGSDGGTTGTVFAWIFYAFLLWGLVLLVIGVRTVHGWTWARSIAGVAWAAAIAAGLAVALTLLYAAG
ncbi:MAG: YIP1 family protein [Gaiellaceae bacterium]